MAYQKNRITQNENKILATGDFLNNKANSLSGYSDSTFYPITNPNDYTTNAAISSSYATINNLESTGQQVWNAANNNATNLSGNLQTTGLALDNKIDSLSGYGNDTFATTLNLTQTGVSLGGKIDSLSGYSNSNFATISNLTLTGQQVWNAANNNALNLSGNLQTTGSILDSKINSLSGYGDSMFYLASNPNNYITTSTVSSTYATIANLQTTGSTLDNKISSLSGYSDSVFATANNLALTGQQVWSTANNNATNLSGNLQATGSTLDLKIDDLSGYSNNTFSIIKITGSDNISNANFTGVGNARVTYNGNYIVVSGISSESAGEANTASNLGGGIGIFSDKDIYDLRFYSLSGVDGINLNINNSTIEISSNINTDSFATIINLEATGSVLDGKINSLSGYSNSTFYLATNPNNYIDTSAVSSTYATIANLQTTGSTLDSKINSLSGYSNATFYLASNPSDYVTTSTANSTYATISNLVSTGSTLDNKINSLSGYSNNSFATITNLASTGQQTWSAANNNAINLSGNLQTTGSTLDGKINSLSGYSNSTFATISNLESTGSNLFTTKLSTGAFLNFSKITVSSGVEPVNPGEWDLWVDLA